MRTHNQGPPRPPPRARSSFGPRSTPLVKPPPVQTQADGSLGARHAGPSEGRAELRSARLVPAAYANLERALDATAEALDRGRVSSGRVRARLRAAHAAVSALEGARPLPNLGALRRAAAHLAARDDVSEPLAGQLAARLTELEATRLLDELGEEDPAARATAEATIARAPDPAGVRRWLATLLPGPEGLGASSRALRAKLDADLTRGDLGRELAARLSMHGVPPDDVEGFFSLMAELRAGFEAGAGAPDAPEADRDMQRTNWIHTRAEVVKAARAFEHAHPPAEDDGQALQGLALLTSLVSAATSDAFKDASQHSLLWHNRPAAALVLPLLVRRHFGEQTARALLPVAQRLVAEHQITPAMFMAGALRAQLSAAGVAEDVVEEIAEKVADPLRAPQADGEIVFSEAAKRALEAVGLEGWSTMDPAAPHFALSQIVAFADVQQYVAPDGIIKIAVDIRSPDHPAAFMRDPNIRAAIDSCVGFSFARGMDAIEHAALLEQGALASERMQQDLHKEVYPEIERRLKAARGLPEHARLPEVPYWNVDVPTDGKLSDEERAAVHLVKTTLRDVLAEHGDVPLDPFGAKEQR